MAQSCSPGPKPSFSEVAERYYDHQSSFEKVKGLACAVPPSHGKKLRSDTEDITNKILREALNDIGVTSISAQKIDVECKISLTYYAVVFGGNGVSYNFIRNLKIYDADVYDPKVHKFESLKDKKNEDMKFYMALDDDWYFLFNRS